VNRKKKKGKYGIGTSLGVRKKRQHNGGERPNEENQTGLNLKLLLLPVFAGDEDRVGFYPTPSGWKRRKRA